MIFRVLEIPPDMKDRKKHIELMKEVNRKVKQKYPPTDKDLERHPTMHRTDTLDCFVVMRGEVYLVSDTDEVLLRAGDTAVVQGVNHAWSNRSNEPVLIAGVMTHAKPLPKERYPAPGL
jgi:mannose-6-phosphate isomerase-like protein (cupin superfamily)